MSAWLKRFGLHTAAAIGATGIFVAAAAVGANQTRQQGAAVSPVQVASSPTPRARRKPTVDVAPSPTPGFNVAQTEPNSTHPPASSSASPGGPTPVPPRAVDVPPPGQADSATGTVQTSPGTQQPAAQPSGQQSGAQESGAQPGGQSGAQQPGTQLPPTQQPAPAGPPAPAPAAPNQPVPKPAPRRSPTPAAAPVAGAAPASAPAAAPTAEKVVPERSLAGTIQDVLPDGFDVLGVGGREWRVVPAPGALVRLNGKTVPLDALRVGDTVVILGQAQGKDGPLFRFVSHAITARRK